MSSVQGAAGGKLAWWESRRTRDTVMRAVSYVVVIAGAAILTVPFLWMLSSSLKPAHAVFASPPQWIPDPVMWRNYVDAWTAMPFTRFLINTVFIIALGLSGELLSCTVVAYGFARYQVSGTERAVHHTAVDDDVTVRRHPHPDVPDLAYLRVD